jgi:hypothetical protein
MDLLGVGVEKKFVGVISQSFRRFMSTVHTVSVDQARTSLGKVAVPDLVRLFRHLDAVSLTAARLSIEAQLDLLCMLGK